MITARVVCERKSKYGEGDERAASVVFRADYADDRNKEWSVVTPSLSVSMTLRGAAVDHFEAGERYVLQFVLAED